MSSETLPAFIQRKLEIDHIISPFSLYNPPIKNFMINPLGLVKKHDTNPLEYWVITQHLASHSASVNDGIDKYEFRISFDTLKYAVK